MARLHCGMATGTWGTALFWGGGVVEEEPVGVGGGGVWQQIGISESVWRSSRGESLGASGLYGTLLARDCSARPEREIKSFVGEIMDSRRFGDSRSAKESQQEAGEAGQSGRQTHSLSEMSLSTLQYDPSSPSCLQHALTPPDLTSTTL